uniref:Uncharacterized protein n=1 Tax=Lotharella globosa TaxID=91324 RepID=A0A7S3ZA48_9EUKA
MRSGGGRRRRGGWHVSAGEAATSLECEAWNPVTEKGGNVVPSADITYRGPLGLVSRRGREGYTQLMEDFKRQIKQRLNQAAITTLNQTRLGPGEQLTRWAVTFVAPIPLPVRLGVRQLPPSAKVNEETDTVECRVDILSRFRLNPNGEVVEHSDQILNEYGLDDVIALFNFLMALRTDENLISWYLDVNSAMTREELSGVSDDFRVAGDEDFQQYFAVVILRNFLIGFAIPATAYALYKLAKMM